MRGKIILWALVILAIPLVIANPVEDFFTGLGSVTGNQILATRQLDAIEVVSHQWDESPPNQMTELVIDKEDIAFTHVQFVTELLSKGPSVTVTSLSRKPLSTSVLYNGDIFQYLNVRESSMKKLRTVTLFFRIPKTWMEEHSVPRDNIKLYRHFEYGWRELATTYVRSDLYYHEFKATTNGFGYFAMGGFPAERIASVVETPEPTVPVDKVETQVMEESVEIDLRIILGIAGGVVVMIVLIFLLFGKTGVVSREEGLFLGKEEPSHRRSAESRIHIGRISDLESSFSRLKERNRRLDDELRRLRRGRY